MADKNVTIEVIANSDAAISAISRLTSSLDTLSDKIGNVGKGGKPPEHLDTIEKQLLSLQALPGPVGDGIGKLAGVFEMVGGAATTAGGAADIAFAPLLATIAVLVVAIGGAVAALKGLYDMASNFVDKAKEWGLAVNEFRELTGATAEASSAILALGQSVGVSAEEMTQMATAQARIMGAANEQMEKISQAEADAKASAQAKEQQLFQAHNDKLAGIHQKTADDIAAQDEQQAQKAEDYRRQADQSDEQYQRQAAQRDDQYKRSAGDREQQYAQKVMDMRAQMSDAEESYADSSAERTRAYNQTRLDDAQQLADRLDQLEQSHSDKLASLQQSLSDLQESYDQKRQDRQDRLNEQLAALDERRGSQRDAIEQRIGASRDKFEREALTSELQAFDQRTADEKAKLEKKAAEEEAKAKAEEDKKIARLQASLQRETDQYAQQTAKLQAEYDKREARAAEAYQRETARAQEAHDKQIAQLQDRIARENDAYKKQAADAKYAYDLSVENAKYANDKQTENARYAYDQQVEAHKKADDKILADTEKRIEDENKAYKKAMGDVQTQLTDVLSKAEQSVPPVVKAVQDLGLSWAALQKLDPAAQQWALLDALGGVEDGAKKSAIEMLLYGRAGTAVNDVADAAHKTSLPKQIEKTRELGLLQGGEATENAVKLRDTQAQLNQKWEAMQIAIGEHLMPAFQTLMDKIKEFLEKHGDQLVSMLVFVIDNVIPPLLDGMGNFLIHLGHLSDWVATNKGPLGEIFDILGKVVRILTDPVGSGIQMGNDIGAMLSKLITGRATGGPVNAGQIYNVEENEPEFFIPNQNGAIVPLSKAAAAGISAAGATTVHNWYITASYAHQPEVELSDSIRMLAKSMNR